MISLYLTLSFLGTSHDIVRIDPSGLQTTISSFLSPVFPYGIAIDAADNIWVATANMSTSTGEIVRVDPLTGTQTSISIGGYLVSPVGLALDAFGSVIVADIVANAVIRVDPVGAQTVISSGGLLTNPAGLTLDASGNIFVTLPFANAVVRVDSASGIQTLISSGGLLASPWGITSNAAGDLLVASTSGGRIIRIDASDSQSIVSSFGLLVQPYGIAVDDVDNIFVADRGFGDVIRVDPATATQTLLSPGGGALNSPFGIAVVPEQVVPVSEPPTLMLVLTSILAFGSSVRIRARQRSGHRSRGLSLEPSPVADHSLSRGG